MARSGVAGLKIDQDAPGQARGSRFQALHPPPGAHGGLRRCQDEHLGQDSTQKAPLEALKIANLLFVGPRGPGFGRDRPKFGLIRSDSPRFRPCSRCRSLNVGELAVHQPKQTRSWPCAWRCMVLHRDNKLRSGGAMAVRVACTGARSGLCARRPWRARQNRPCMYAVFVLDERAVIGEHRAPRLGSGPDDVFPGRTSGFWTSIQLNNSVITKVCIVSITLGSERV